MPDSKPEHALFHLLVVMGGFALSCGGNVSVQAGPDGAGASGTSSGGSTAGAFSSVGGTGVAGAVSSSGGSTYNGAGGVAFDAGATSLPCPPEQWDCSPLLSRCGTPLIDGVVFPAGCSCDLSRPISAAACTVEQNLLCVGVYDAASGTHYRIQCACVSFPFPDSYQACLGMCDENAPNDTSSRFTSVCMVPATTTCDAQGVCTAISADVLSQEAILCGCAHPTVP